MQLPRTPSFRLDGRRALVTGASSGIGQAAAAALAGAGAELVVVARRGDALDALCEAIRAEGGRADPHALDITDLDATAAMVAQKGPFDVLVNAAGMARHSQALDTRVADYDAVMGLNLRAAYFLTRTVAEGLVAAGKPGSLINISSQLAHVGCTDRAVYCASKHGVEGMTRAMAIEWGPRGIRVNTLCPTFVRTPLTQAAVEDPERLAWFRDRIPLGRVGEVEDMMGAVVFLASDASALVTGASLLVDGGWTAA